MLLLSVFSSSVVVGHGGGGAISRVSSDYDHRAADHDAISVAIPYALPHAPAPFLTQHTNAPSDAQSATEPQRQWRGVAWNTNEPIFSDGIHIEQHRIQQRTFPRTESASPFKRWARPPTCQRAGGGSRGLWQPHPAPHASRQLRLSDPQFPDRASRLLPATFSRPADPLVSVAFACSGVALVAPAAQ